MATTVGGIQFSISLNTTGVAQNASKIVNSFKYIQQNFDKADKSASNLAQTLDVLNTVAAGFAAGYIKDFAKNVTLLAARVENLQTIVRNVGRTAGLNVAQIDLLENRVKALGITTQEARNGITLLAQSQLKLENATKLARIAQDAAVIANLNSSEAYGRLVLAIQRGDSRLLRNLGIVVNLAQVYQDYATSVGRSANTLTPLEKRQLILNEVFKKGDIIAGTYEASLTDVNKQYTSMARYVEEAQVAIGQRFLPVFRELIKFQTDFLKTSPNFARLSSDAIAFGAALSALTVAVGGARLGIAALGGLASPIGVLAVSLAAVAAAYQDILATGEESRLSLRAAAASGQQFTQRLDDARVAAQELRDVLSKPIDSRTTKETASIKTNVEQLKEAFPELRTVITKAFEEGRLSELLGSGAFKVMQGDIKSTTGLAEELDKKIKELASELAVLNKEGKTSDVLAENLRKSVTEVGNVEDAVSKATEALQRNVILEKAIAPISDRLPGADPRDSEYFANYQKRIQDLGNTISTLNGILQQTARLDADRELAELTDQLGRIPEVAKQAEDQLKQLATQRRKVFKDTNIIILEDLQRLLAKQDVIVGASQEKIERLVDLQISAELRNSQENQQKALQAIAGASDEAVQRAQIDEKYRAQRAAILASRLERVRSLTDDLATAQKALAESVKLAELRLEEEAESIAALETQAEALEKGIDLDMVRAQKRFQKQTIEASKVIKEQKRLIEENTKAAVAASKDGREEEAARFREAVRLTEQAQEQTLRKQRANERIFIKESYTERKQAIDRLTAEEQRAIERIAEVRGLAAANTLEQVEKLVEAQKRARQEVDEFIRDLSQSNVSDPGGHNRKFLDFVDNFRKNIEKARPDQLDILKKLFPIAQRRVLKEISRDLDEIDLKFRRFTEDYGKTVGEIDRRAADRLEELIASGAGESTARAEVERQRQRELQDLKLQSEQLKEQKRNADLVREQITTNDRLRTDLSIKRQQEELKEAQEVARTQGLKSNQEREAEAAFDAQFKVRKQQLKDEAVAGLDDLTLKNKLVTLQDEEVAKNQQIIDQNREKLAFFKQQLDVVNELVQRSEELVSKSGFGRIGPGVGPRLEELPTPKPVPLTPEEQRRVKAREFQDSRVTSDAKKRADELFRIDDSQIVTDADREVEAALIRFRETGEKAAAKTFKQLVEGALAQANKEQSTVGQGDQTTGDIEARQALAEFYKSGAVAKARKDPFAPLQYEINEKQLAVAEEDDKRIGSLEDKFKGQVRAWEKAWRQRMGGK